MSAETELLEMAKEALATAVKKKEASEVIEEVKWPFIEVEELDTDRKNMTLTAVLIYDDKGNYLIHGSNSETTAEMLKAMAPLWAVDPSTEIARVIQIPVSLPTVEGMPSVRVFNNPAE